MQARTFYTDGHGITTVRSHVALTLFVASAADMVQAQRAAVSARATLLLMQANANAVQCGITRIRARMLWATLQRQQMQTARDAFQSPHDAIDEMVQTLTLRQRVRR